MSIKNRDLFEKARSARFEADASLLSFVLERKNLQVQDDVDSLSIDLFLKNFVKLARKKWGAAGAHVKSMEAKFGYPGGWLDQEAKIPDLDAKKTPQKTQRKTKDFLELSKRSKNRETAELRASNETAKLVHAVKSSLKQDGESDLAFVISEASKSPTRATKFRRLSGAAESMEKVPSAPVSLPRKISADDALAHLLHSKLTQDSYVDNRLMCKSHGADIWPTYHDVLAAKKLCRPTGITYGETAVTVPIENRLRHNDERLLQIYNLKFQDLLEDVEDGGVLEVEGEAKIGFDGSTGNSMYNQAFSLENRDASDESLLSTCLVPLQYKIKNAEVIFRNPTPQGPTFCQPVRLEYRKETPEASKDIDSWIDDAIAALTLTPNVIQVGSKFVKFHHKIFKTMLDGKGKNACTDTASSLRCFLCGASSKHLNDVESLVADFPTDESKLVYGGIADLHAWLRAFDAINSLSDKLTVKKWSIRNKEDKATVAARKLARQAAFKEKLGLLVDVPKGGGSGNSNTGNTARRAFQDEATFADITGVDQELIHRIHMMLVVINTDHVIDESKFKTYGYDTAALWAALYEWCYMSITLHQLFFHAWESIRFSSLPLSFFTEQSLESCNKTFKNDRENHSRKDSRLHTIEDQFHRQSDRSDLVIGLKLSAKQKKKMQEPLPQDALNLLVIESDNEEP